MIKYTLGFVKCRNEVLLLSRENPGWMGCFNGVGGRIEEGETPFDSFKRELFEETGIITDKIKLCGQVTWHKNHEDGGAFIFLVEIDEKPFHQPKIINEGLLVWKSIPWITHPENKGVAKNVLPYIEKLFDNEKQLKFVTKDENGQFSLDRVVELDELTEYESESFEVSKVDYLTLAKNILNKEYDKNVNILYFLSNNNFHSIYVLGNNVIMKLKNDGIFIRWDKKTNFKYINDLLNLEDKKFYMIDDLVRVQLDKTRTSKWISQSIQYYFNNNHQLDKPKKKVVSLKVESVDYILENMHYKLGYSKELLLKRISEGLSSAVYEGDKLVAWAYTHDDNSLGGLNVINEYRRKGYARDVCLDLIKKIYARDGYVFLQIEKSNYRSKALFESLGFVKSHNITWVGYL